MTNGRRREDFARLQRAKDDTLKALLARKPSEKRYRRALNAYLEADHALQRAIIERLGLDFRE
jgi:hypothetical protein